jgi:hypothetical protein
LSTIGEIAVVTTVSGLPELDELDELGDEEPQAAIPIVRTAAAATLPAILRFIAFRLQRVPGRLCAGLS